jgi:hypothetical protein
LGGLTDGKMKFGIRLYAGVTAFHLLALFFEQTFHASDISGCGPLGGQRGNLRLDQLAHLEDIRKGILFLDQHSRQWRDQRLYGQVGDEIAHARAADHQSLGFERAQRFAYRCAAYVERFRQFSLGG